MRTLTVPESRWPGLMTRHPARGGAWWDVSPGAALGGVLGQELRPCTQWYGDTRGDRSRGGGPPGTGGVCPAPPRGTRIRGLLPARCWGRGDRFNLSLSRSSGIGRIDETGGGLRARESRVAGPELSPGHGWRGCSVRLGSRPIGPARTRCRASRLYTWERAGHMASRRLPQATCSNPRLRGRDHLIRRLCRIHPLPAHSAADLPKRYSLVRSR